MATTAQAPSTSVKVLRPFSLLEVMIVLAVLGLAGGAIGIKSYRAVQSQRFESAVETLVSKITLAQQIMLCCATNVHLTIDEGKTLRMEADDNLPPNFKPLLKPIKLKGIEQIALNETDDLQLNFIRDAGYQITQGNLHLIGSGCERYVHLPGYPTRVKTGVEPQRFEVRDVAEAPPLPTA